MNSDKLLTAIVPAYNAAAFLSKCLDSFCGESVRPLLEVIVVNDGSKDDTSAVAHRYSARYPECFRVIDKENGGHGSAINLGSQQASGKYLQVVDSDDWVVAENLPELMRILRENSADVVLCNYHMVDKETGKKQAFETVGAEFGQVYPIDRFVACSKRAWNCCYFHGVIYRADFYRNMDFRVSEKTFYEDQEYATIPFFYANTVLPVDLFIYQYQVGDVHQSISNANQVKNLNQLENIFWNITDFYCRHRSEMTDGMKAFFLFKLSNLLTSYYAAGLIKDSNRSRGKACAEAMRKQVAERCPELAEQAERGYRTAFVLHKLHISSELLERVKRTKAYHMLRGKI